MPVGIDHCTSQTVVTRFEEYILSVLMYHCSTMLTSHMEHILLRIRTILGMTVHALSMHLRILQHRRFCKVRETTLIQPHMTIERITGRNTAIGNAPFVKRIRTNLDRKVAILIPVPLSACHHRHQQTTSLVSLQ